jgi:D-alanyl-D-alanine carboxypeptidase
MQNNFPKFVLLAVVIAVVFFSAKEYPGIFISGNASTVISSTTVPANGFTSLSADIGAQDGVTAASPTQEIIVAANGSTTPFIRVGDTTPPNVGLEAAVVADLETGDNFMSINADERWPMASISKLMTAVVATDVLQPGDEVTITPEMTAVDPTEHILNVGDTYTVEDLLHIMLLPSNNVAATALADFYGEQNFLAAMNAKAQSWGMTSTYYDDPSGLSAANESTADDLLKLAQNIYTNYPQILAITRMPTATVNNLATGKPVVVKSINEFAGDVDFIGGKTGYTDQADGNLLSLFSYEGRPIFIVVLGIDDGVRFDGTQELYTWFKANFK